MKIHLYLPVLLLLTVAAAGQQHPNVERGFLPDKSYQLGDVDTVNLFNGTLNATIPLGQRYPVNGGLSYQFVLSYATNGWEVGEHQYTDHVDYPPYLIERFNHYSYPARHMNAGFGWMLSFGRLHREHPSNTWVYYSPDGAQHSFYGTLHANNAQETANLGPNPKITYSRDGTYLRLREYSDNAKLDFPNGDVHQFDATGRLVSMTDSFGNSMSIIYGVRATGVYAGSPQWTIIDTTGRAHYVYFRPAPSYAELAYATPEQHDRIDYIDLAAFDDPAVSGDGRAEYHLEYSSDGNVVLDSVLLSRRCPHSEPELNETVRVGMLKAIQMPENLRYEMTYDLGSQSFCSQMYLDGSGSASGNLTEIKLMTGAKIGFQYAAYDYPSSSAWEFPSPGDPAETMYFSTVPGIKSRIVKDSDGTTVLANTEYQPDRYNAGFGENAQRRIVRHKNGQSLVKEVHHYFAVCVVNICGNGREYGLPLTRLGMPAGGPFLSTETFVPDASGNLVPAGSSWLRFEGDGNLNTNSLEFNFNNDLNRRVSYSKTVHDDGTYTEATNSSFDGLGHYRQTLTKSNVTGTVTQRTSLTNFNPARGTFNVDANGVYSGDFTMPPTNGKWNLGMFDYQRMIENGLTSTVATCFNADGFLTGRRVYAAFGSSPALQGKDLLTLFTPDTGTGNVNVEQYLGGDLGYDDGGVPAPTSAICPSNSTDNYRIEHRYQSGVRKASYFIGPGGSPFSHFILDTDVDANTGLVKARRDASTVGSGGVSAGDGLKTEIKYDALGRMTLETPPSTATNRGARKRVAFSSNGRKVDLFEENLSGTVIFRSTSLDLDGLGRIKKESRSIPGGPTATASRTWEFDGIGRLTAASSWGNPGVMTRFEYDPFGRATKVTAPDGSETTYSYIGIRQSSSTSRVRTGVSQESNATTVADYDVDGRLLRLTDPAGIKTRYTYDVAGRLTNVCADENAGCTQNRVFTYDNRGFLTAEQMPELGASGNGTASYFYDAKGNVVQRTVGAALGAFDVKTEFDRAGRVKRIFEAGSGRSLKMFEYGSTNPGGDYKNGRMTRAIRYNWVSVGASAFNVQVIEDYSYAGRDGRISNRTTYDSECPITPTATCTTLFDGLEKRSFTQGFTYDELGTVTSSSLPTCTIGDCLAANIPGRTVTNGYDKGWLTSVNWTSAPQPAAIAYHNNGMVASVTHPNQVLDQVLLDPLQIPRPHEIKTTNVIDPDTCTPPTFTTQPQSSTITSGTSVNLSAKAEGETSLAITYRWYRGTYPDTSNLVKTETLASGVTAWFATPNLTATTSYWVKATNSCDAAGTASQTAVLTTCTVPSIAAQPQSHSMTRSQSYTLSVTAGGSAPLSYQWYTMSGSTATVINGATASELTVTPQSTTTYRVTITNSCGSLNSNSAVVTVLNPPGAPGSVTATSNGSTNTVTWTASSSGAGIDYYEVQRRNGSTFTVQVPGSLTFTNGPSGVTPGTAYLYRVRGVDLNGVAGPWSVYDLTTTMTFTDDPLVAGSTLVKGVHVAQLRQAIDAIRTEAGLSPAWGSGNGASGLIFVGHVVDMRSSLNEARLVLGLGTIPVAQQNLNPFGLMFVTYMNELRNGVK